MEISYQLEVSVQKNNKQKKEKGNENGEESNDDNGDVIHLNC